MKPKIKVINYKKKEVYCLLEDETLLIELYKDDDLTNCQMRKHETRRTFSEDQFFSLVKSFNNPEPIIKEIMDKLNNGTPEEKRDLLNLVKETLTETLDDMGYPDNIKIS
mgnify:CR=1 FL=1